MKLDGNFMHPLLRTLVLFPAMEKVRANQYQLQASHFFYAVANYPPQSFPIVDKV
jgi:hypothetical protein